jgi:flagellar biosynthesis protein FlhG
MHDQANDLRELVRRRAPPAAPAVQPRRIVVAGGKGGVGTTTIAVHLTMALTRRGTPAMLVDTTGDAAILCRLDPRYTLADVLCGVRTVAEAIQGGPGGILVLPGSPGPDRPSEHAPGAMHRLLAQIAEQRPQTEVIVLDAGNSPTRAARRLWQAADLVLLVATPSAAAIMDTYSAIKLLAEPDRSPPLHLLVNMAPDDEAAADMHRRLEQACRRFLSIDLACAGHVPVEAKLSAAADDFGKSGNESLERLADSLLEGAAVGKASMEPCCEPASAAPELWRL